jgi:hypothetical protein
VPAFLHIPFGSMHLDAAAGRGTLTCNSASILCFFWQAVAPGAAFGRAGTRKDRRMGRASALVLVCGLAACVALLGSLGDAEEPVNQAFLAVKAELQDKPAIQLKGKVLHLAPSVFLLRAGSAAMSSAANSSQVQRNSSRVSEYKRCPCGVKDKQNSVMVE